VGLIRSSRLVSSRLDWDYVDQSDGIVGRMVLMLLYGLDR
jgi:hypothetical protein